MKNTSLSPLPLAPYLALARELSDALTPLQPRSEFRAQLYHSLVASAATGERATAAAVARESLVDIPARLARWVAAAPLPGRRWVWGAAAVGSAVSLAGLMTYVLWLRRGHRVA